MLFVRYKCPECGEIHKRLGIFADENSTSTCPKCGRKQVPLLEEDAKKLEIERKAKESCTRFG